jgi:hypothetical protein
MESTMSMYDRIQDGPYTGKGISAGASLGMESAKIGKLEKRSALSENADTLSDARRLACRVQHLVDRFCGRIPTPEGSAEDNSTMAISPILDDLREDAARTGYEVRRAMERLDHLEAQLP